MVENKKYRIPSGVRIKPSQLGYYNFWYPHEHDEYVSMDSLVCEQLLWRGSDKWQAVKVSADEAKLYDSPIRVVWIEKNLFNYVKGAPLVRETLKARAVENEQ